MALFLFPIATDSPTRPKSPPLAQNVEKSCFQRLRNADFLGNAHCVGFAQKPNQKPNQPKSSEANQKVFVGCFTHGDFAQNLSVSLPPVTALSTFWTD
jgi:hypothetical protein